MTRRASRLQAFMALLGLFVLVAARPDAQPGGLHPAGPVDAIGAIVDAFRTHVVVGLGDMHGSKRLGEFRLALIRDVRFQAAANDIVVEFGASTEQEVVDRFVNGASVPDRDLRRVWEDAAPNPVWDRPVYEQFFRAVREVNQRLPASRRLRVLLGGPPIDWNTATAEDYRRWNLARGAFTADLVAREVTGKHRRALAVIGDGHFQARTERPPRSLGARLSLQGIDFLAIASASGRIADLQPDAATWPVPAVAFVKDTPIGAAAYERFYGPMPPGAYWLANARFQDHYEAVLYLGPAESDSQSPLTYPRCAEPEYLAMRVRRMEIAGMRPPAGAPTIGERVKQECHAP
jgi:hypothetical protein